MSVSVNKNKIQVSITKFHDLTMIKWMNNEWMNCKWMNSEWMNEWMNE